MDKIFHSTFDFFSYAIPGVCIVGSFYLLDEKLRTLPDFLAEANKANVGTGILLLLVGYVIGFAIYPLGRFMYKKVKARFWGDVPYQNVDLFIADKYVLIRELSPNNFKYVETWNRYCAMAHNLSTAALFIALFATVKVIWLNPGNLFFWIIFIIGIWLLFGLLLRRAVIFSIWATDDINAAIRCLNLLERAKELPATTSS